MPPALNSLRLRACVAAVRPLRSSDTFHGLTFVTLLFALQCLCFMTISHLERSFGSSMSRFRIAVNFSIVLGSQFHFAIIKRLRPHTMLHKISLLSSKQNSFALYCKTTGKLYILFTLTEGYPPSALAFICKMVEGLLSNSVKMLNKVLQELEDPGMLHIVMKMVYGIFLVLSVNLYKKRMEWFIAGRNVTIGE